MRTKEAIEIISTTPVAYPDPDAQGVWDEAIRMALSALKKQEAQKPVEARKFADILIGYCPACGDCGNSEFEYCCKCGQKFDWEI